MADISQIKVSSVTYDIKDTTARAVATSASVGRVKPDGTSTFVDANGVLSSAGVGGGTNFTISTDESSLIGKTITITDGTVTTTTVFDNNGEANVVGYLGTGWVTISCSDGTDTAYAYEDCSYYGLHRVELNFWSATVNLSTSNFQGETVHIKSDVAPPSTVTFSNQGVATYIVHMPGIYEFYVEEI